MNTAERPKGQWKVKYGVTHDRRRDCQLPHRHSYIKEPLLSGFDRYTRKKADAFTCVGLYSHDMLHVEI